MKEFKDYHIQYEKKEGEEITLCPKCTKERKNKLIKTLYLNHQEKTWFCRHCGFNGNLFDGEYNYFQRNNSKFVSFNPVWKKHQEKVFNLSNKVIEAFLNKGVKENILKQYNINQQKIYVSDLGEEVVCTVFPYYKDQKIVNAVYLYRGKRYSEKGGAEICYGYDDIDEKETIFVVNEIDKLILTQEGFKNSVSLFGGEENLWQKNNFYKEGKNKILDSLINIEEKIKNVKKILVLMPNNEIGAMLKEELIRRIGKEKCWIAQIPEECETLSDVVNKYDYKKIKSIINSATAVPIKGIFDLNDVEEEIESLYLNGLRKGYSTGYNCLNEYYTVVPGQITIVTGIPSHGKSNFLDALLVNLGMLHSWRFAIFSPENQPVARHFASIMEKYADAPFYSKTGHKMSISDKDQAKKWVNEHFSVILPDEDQPNTIDGILQLAKILVYRKGIKGLVIDPWNEIEHSRPAYQTETEYISHALSKIRRFAREYDVHVWLVAHPTKLQKDKDGKYPVPTPYDISGSSHFRNKADCALSIWRNVGERDQDITDIHIQKIRFKEVGTVGVVSLSYNVNSGRFLDNLDQAKRREAQEKGIILTSKDIRKKIVHSELI